MKESGMLFLKEKLALLKNLFKKKEAQPQSVTNPEPAEQPRQKSENMGKKILEVIRILCLAAYRLRGIFLAIPVIFAALWLAGYNSEHLPLLVGLDLQSTGEFARTISRQSAVTFPLMITGGCLVLMCFSRKTLYPWLISVFSLVIPILLLVTNTLPA